MYLGRIVEVGPTEEVLERPAAPVHAGAAVGRARDPARGADRCWPASRRTRPGSPAAAGSTRAARRSRPGRGGRGRRRRPVPERGAARSSAGRRSPRRLLANRAQVVSCLLTHESVSGPERARERQETAWRSTYDVDRRGRWPQRPRRRRPARPAGAAHGRARAAAASSAGPRSASTRSARTTRSRRCRTSSRCCRPRSCATCSWTGYGYHVYPQGPYFAPHRDGRYLQLPADHAARREQIEKFSSKDADAIDAWDAQARRHRPRARPAALRHPAEGRVAPAGRPGQAGDAAAPAARRGRAQGGRHHPAADVLASPTWSRTSSSPTRCAACSRSPASSAPGPARARPAPRT